MTSLPARTFSFATAAWCAKVSGPTVMFEPRASKRKPRFRTASIFRGFDLVLVNGQAVVESGKSPDKPGQVLRHRAP
jgi:hypothetical protein